MSAVHRAVAATLATRGVVEREVSSTGNFRVFSAPGLVVSPCQGLTTLLPARASQRAGAWSDLGRKTQVGRSLTVIPDRLRMSIHLMGKLKGRPKSLHTPPASFMEKGW